MRRSDGRCGPNKPACASASKCWRMRSTCGAKRGRHVLTQPGQTSLRTLPQRTAGPGGPSDYVRLSSMRSTCSMPPKTSWPAWPRTPSARRAETPAARLLKRARTEYDMRGTDPDATTAHGGRVRQSAGMAQDDDAILEIEEALKDPDPLVREVAALTAIQLHRFRALRVADLDVAHRSTQKLAQIKFPAAIPVLVEILEKPRTGFVTSRGRLRGTRQRPLADGGTAAPGRVAHWRGAEGAASAAVRSRLQYRQGRGTCSGSVPRRMDRPAQARPGRCGTKG